MDRIDLRHFFSKIIIAVLAAVMVIAYMPPPAFAEDGQSATSTDTAASVTNGEYSITLPDGKIDYTWMRKMNVIVTAPASDTDAWVGLYPEDVTPHYPTVPSIFWYYVKDHPGTPANMMIQQTNTNSKDKMKTGLYKLVLFSDGTADKDGHYTVEAELHNIQINEPSAEEKENFGIELQKTTFTAGEPIMVKAQGVGASNDAWVGLYRKGDTYDPVNGGVASFYWYSVKDHNEEWTDITAAENNAERGFLTPGTYELYLFKDGGYSQPKVTKEIVINPGSESPDSVSLDVDDADDAFEPGPNMALNVTASGTGTNGDARVGLYLKDDPEDGSVEAMRSYYVARNNNRKVNLLKCDRGNRADGRTLPSGGLDENGQPISYEVRLIGSSGKVLARKEIRVKAYPERLNFSLKLNKTSFVEGEKIMTTAAGIGNDGRAWVGIYRKGDDYKYGATPSIYYYYIKDHEGQAVAIQDQHNNKRTDVESLPAGEYDVILFDSQEYHPVEKQTITVVRETLEDDEIIREPGCDTLGLKKCWFKDRNGKPEWVPIEALGHEWSEWKSNGNATHTRTCARDASHQETQACSSQKELLKRPAKIGQTGIRTGVCSVCGQSYEKVIPAAASVQVRSMIYDGDSHLVKITVKDTKGNIIPSSQYTYSPKSVTKTGKFNVSVKFRGDHAGTVKTTGTVKPATVAIKKAAAGKRALTIKWKSSGSSVTGYQIQLATDSKFKKNAKKIKVKGYKVSSKKVKKLKASKKYYIRVRAYKTNTLNGKKVTTYSSWSKVTSRKTRK